MSKLKVAFQGEPGANSDIAAREVYPDCEPLPCATFEDALAAIQTGKAELGMIPIENSIAGRVADIHHLLPHAKLHIVGEHFLPIHFNLMAPKGATLKTVKSVESHIHALGQCRRFIRKHGYKAVIAADTAGAARAYLGDERRDARRARAEARGENLRPQGARRERRGRGPQHDALRDPLAQAKASPSRTAAWW